MNPSRRDGRTHVAKSPIRPRLPGSARVAHPFASFAKGWDCGHRTNTTFKNFHKPDVTSDLVCQFQIGDHGRGRDGWHKPTRRAPKSFLSRILVPKLLDIRILRGISVVS